MIIENDRWITYIHGLVYVATYPDSHRPPHTQSDKGEVDESVPGGEGGKSSLSWLQGRERERERETERHRLRSLYHGPPMSSYAIFLDAEVDGVFYPGYELNGVDDADHEIHTHYHHKPHKLLLTATTALQTGHKRSREYEGEKIHKGADPAREKRGECLQHERDSGICAYRKNWRRYLFSTKTRKNGQHLCGVPSSTSSSTSLSPSSDLVVETPLSAGGWRAPSFWKVTAEAPPRALRVRRGDTALRRWALLDSLLRRESPDEGAATAATAEGDEEDMTRR